MVMNQDSQNMPFVQKGVHNLKIGVAQLSDYNETKLRHFHELLEAWIERP